MDGCNGISDGGCNGGVHPWLSSDVLVSLDESEVWEIIVPCSCLRWRVGVHGIEVDTQRGICVGACIGGVHPQLSSDGPVPQGESDDDCGMGVPRS